MDYHVKISANIYIKRIVDETETETSNLSSSESMITEPSSTTSSETNSSIYNNNINLMDYDDESYNPSNSESSNESMITDEDSDSNDSFKTATETISRLYPLMTSERKTRVSITKRAGLIFPVKRLYNKLKSVYQGKRVSMRGCIELAGVLEYLTAELLEISGNQTNRQDESLIVPRHIFLAVQDDVEYKKVFNHVTLPESGTIESPHLIKSKYKPKKK